ncbi:MAG: hypothetical protein RLZZ546_3135 [Bacteroidota bacterium]|jgi:ATP/ADP translocase
MDVLKNSYLVVPLAIIITIIMVYINSVTTNETVEKHTYIKLSILIALVSGFIVYINTGTITGIEGGESIMKGPAPF